MKNAIFFFIPLVLFSCGKTDFEISNLNGNQISVLGHGGMGLENIYPVNSYESVLNCLFSGADGSEMDVQLTADSVLVLFHDRDLNETTDLEGLIIEKNWEEIQAAVYNAAPYLNYQIISLDQLLGNLEDRSKYTYTLDCKLNPGDMPISLYHDVFAKALGKTIEKYGLVENICIESQNTDFLALLKQGNPDYKLFIYPATFEEGLSIAIENDLTGITISHEAISEEQINTAHAQGLQIALWAVRSRDQNHDAILKNPDYIQTDKLKHLIKLLD